MHVHIKHRMHRQRLHAWVVMRQTCTHLTKHARGDTSKIPSDRQHVHIKHSMHKFWLSDVIPHCAITLVLRYVHMGGAV